MKKADKKKWSTKKTWAVTAIAMALLALLIVPVFGWMYWLPLRGSCQRQLTEGVNSFRLG